MTSESWGPLRSWFQIQRTSNARIGIDHVRLLESVAKERSISAGARAVGMSFRGAWNAIQAINALSRQPLVECRVGGQNGGFAHVTPAGQAFIAAFHQIDGELERIVAQLEDHLSGEGGPVHHLVQTPGLNASSCNHLNGVVESLTTGEVSSEVVILSGNLRLCSVLTRQRAQDLALRPGGHVVAIIEASSIILVPGADPLRTSARNRLVGWVAESRVGAEMDEIILEVDGGTRLTAAITRESRERLAFGIGVPVQALIKASQVSVALN